jgi:uncharacterized protein (DUF924 family)
MAEAWVAEVLDYWFALGEREWWNGSPELDADIRERFGIEWARQSRRQVDDFLGSPDEALAAVGMAQVRRGFLYMPFQHSENRQDQTRALLLFTALGDARQLHYARLHHDVIERFGRFPHRNKVLGRKPTAMESAAGEVFPW